MQHDRLNDVNILSETVLPTPEKMRKALPLAPRLRGTVYEFRQQVRRILDGDDRRLLAIVGPCSIHNIGSALQYARRLKALSRDVDDVFMLNHARVFRETAHECRVEGVHQRSPPR